MKDFETLATFSFKSTVPIAPKLISGGRYVDICDQEILTSSPESLNNCLGKTFALVKPTKQNLTLFEVEKLIKSNGYQSAGLEAILLFGYSYPEYRKDLTVIALEAITKSWFGLKYLYCITYGYINKYKSLGKQLSRFYYSNSYLNSNFAFLVSINK